MELTEQPTWTTHRALAQLSPEGIWIVVDRAVERLSWKGRALCWQRNAAGDRIHVLVCLFDHGPAVYAEGRDEYVTWTVCPDSGRRGDVYFEQGHYGCRSMGEALEDLRARGGYEAMSEVEQRQLLNR